MCRKVSEAHKRRKKDGQLMLVVAAWQKNGQQEQEYKLWPVIRLMDKILHDPKDPKLWELWYIPYNG